jgi:hypothetical protein
VSKSGVVEVKKGEERKFIVQGIFFSTENNINRLLKSFFRNVGCFVLSAKELLEILFHIILNNIIFLSEK